MEETGLGSTSRGQSLIRNGLRKLSPEFKPSREPWPEGHLLLRELHSSQPSGLRRLGVMSHKEGKIVGA